MSLLDPAALLAAWERGAGQDPLGRALALLAAASGCTVEEAAALDVGSRDVLLAGLLVASAGASARATVDCTRCRERLDVPVDVAAVARLPVHEPGAVFETPGAADVIRFRLPTSNDLAVLAGCAPAAAGRLLLARCLLGAHSPWSEPDAAVVAEAVEEAMERVAPAGAVEVTVRCGHCGASTAAALDVASLLWAEVDARAQVLVRDVHALARAYGWTEDQVLALSPRRRAAYLELAGA